MPKIKGWNRKYSGTPEETDGYNAPVLKRWKSVFGKEVVVERNHYWQIDDAQFYEDDMPDGEDKWVARSTDWTEYFATKADAVEFAKQKMRRKYTADEVERAEYQLRKERKEVDTE